MLKKYCIHCKSEDTISISTYKRKWLFCNECGSSFPEEKSFYPLSFLPRDYLKKPNLSDPASIYDYFASEAHQKISEQDYFAFYKRYENELQSISSNMNVLDISGGSGHFVKQFKNHANEIIMTEINEKAINNANKNLGIKAIQFDFNKDELNESLKANNIDCKFDFVLMRACSMFCLDLPKFINSMKHRLNKGAKIFITRNVVPTVGVVMRTQFDDFSYLLLRQPETVQKAFSDEFSLLKLDWDRDEFPFYVWDHDLDSISLGISTFYTLSAVWKLRKAAQRISERYPFRARDRKFFSMVLQYNDNEK